MPIVFKAQSVYAIDFLTRFEHNIKKSEVSPCTRGGTEGLAVKLSIQTLCTMLMGYKRPSYLRRIEKITASDEAINLLEDIIPVEQPYFSDYF
ncbi:sterol carrier protein domain-containing protein [Treponema phagedenis]|uniref:sterol carrier protein domain-containing protein n=1 Tax=Treponema phagedenis TaxID=162 RepID=UPI00030B4F7E|nr:sterol carrier protein domain-containing protein [Treponema phagedenis]